MSVSRYIAVFSLTLLAAAPARAANVNVTCDPAALATAITNANANAGADVLNLASGCVYTLQGPTNYWYGPTGLPPVASDITIEGNGATIQRNPAPGTLPFRLFFVGADPAKAQTLDYVTPGAGKLTLRNLTLRSGHAKGGKGGGGGAGMGGAIFNQNHVVLQRVSIVGSYAEGAPVSTLFYGGGGIGSDGTATAGGGFGGNWAAPAGAGTGAAGNANGAGGGAGFAAGENGAAAASGKGGAGGGAENGLGGDGAAAANGGRGGNGSGGGGGPSTNNGAGGGFGGGGSRLDVPGQGSSGGGGGVGGGGAGGVGVGPAAGGGGGFGGGGGTGGDGGFGGGGGIGGKGGWGGGDGNTWTDADTGETRMAHGGGAGLGGGIFNHYGTVEVTDSTFTQNFAIGGGGNTYPLGPAKPGFAAGGAIFNLSGTVSVKDSTLADNHGNGIYSLAYYGGVARNASVTLERTIVAEKSGLTYSVWGDRAATVIGGIANPGTSTINFVGANHLTPAPTLAGATAEGTPIGGAYSLGALADNGGPTQTMLPQQGSPVLDAGGTGCPATDQRGVARPFGSACDIGAVELRQVSLSAVDTTEITTSGATLTATVSNPLTVPIKVRFEYGITDHRATTATETIAPGAQNVTVTAKITGLTPATAFGVLARTIDVTEGAVVAPDRTFTTPWDSRFFFDPFGPQLPGDGGGLMNADLNGDGRTDLIMSGAPSKVLLNTGSGFATPVETVGLGGPYSTKFAQVTGGPAVDAVSASATDLTVTPGNGDGTFGAAASYPIGSQIITPGLALGDVDGDGDVDAVIATQKNGAKPLLAVNTGTGFTIKTLTNAVAIGDARMGDDDGDGDLDLYVSTHAGDAGILQNDGTGDFYPQHGVDGAGLLHGEIVVGDVDGRNGPDIVVGSGSSISVALRAPDGSFVPKPIAYGAPPTALAVSDLGDLDGDGDLDVVATGVSFGAPFTDGLYAFVNDGTGKFAASQLTGAKVASSSAVLAPLDGDAYDDLVYRSNLGLRVLRQRTTTVSPAAPAASVSEEAGAVTLKVNRSGTQRENGSVAYAISGGSAEDADREPVTGRVSFAAGALSTEITVPLHGDAAVEPDETFTLTLSDARGGFVLDPDASSTTVTLTDDDALVGSGPPVGAPAKTIAPSVTLVKTLRQSKLKRGLSVRVTCKAACTGTLKVSVGRRVLGKATVRLTGAGSRTVRVRLSKKNLAWLKRTLRKKASVKATVELRMTKPAAKLTKRLEIKR